MTTPRCLARVVRCLAGALAFALTTPGLAQPFAYMTNFLDDTVTVVDTASNSVVGAPIPVGAAPIAAAANLQGTRVYVANRNDQTLSVIDTASNTVVDTIGGFFTPTCVAVNPAGTFVYVGNGENNDGKDVRVIDTSNHNIVAIIELGPSRPVELAVSADGTRVYVASTAGSDVDVIDTTSNTVIATIPLGSAGTPIVRPTGLDVTPSGSHVYVAIGTDDNNTTQQNEVKVIETATNTIIATVTTDSPAGVVVSPSGDRVYVANGLTDTVSVIDTASNTVIGPPIAVGDNPGGISIHPDGTFVYVANFNDDTISVVDTATNTETATVAVGNGPAGKGEWVGPANPAVIPTVSEWGLIVTGLLLLTSVTLVVRRNARPAIAV